MRKFAITAPIILALSASAALAADAPAADPELAKFREAYTAGKGISYVVINDEKGERIFRYGDASRETAKKDVRGYMLFTCAAPHVFVAKNPPDKASLLKAKVVHAGDASFDSLDGKYVSGCKNPLVKSAKKAPEPKK